MADTFELVQERKKKVKSYSHGHAFEFNANVSHYRMINVPNNVEDAFDAVTDAVYEIMKKVHHHVNVTPSEFDYEYGSIRGTHFEGWDWEVWQDDDVTLEIDVTHLKLKEGVELAKELAELGVSVDKTCGGDDYHDGADYTVKVATEPIICFKKVEGELRAIIEMTLEWELARN